MTSRRLSLVVGLGNPGRSFAGTRHNVGFEVADALSDGAEFKKAARSMVARNLGVFLAKPSTYMNLSGAAVASLLAKYRLSPSEILVVCDDFAIPFGKLRCRDGGSSGGHNGLQSIIESIGGDFPRFRIGVGPLPPGVDAADFVLERVGRKDVALKTAAVAAAAKTISDFIAAGRTCAGTWTVGAAG